MSVWVRILLVVFLIGIALSFLPEFPIAGQWLKDYKDEISSVGTLVAIAAALFAAVRCVFKATKVEKNTQLEKNGDTKITIHAGRDIIGRDKKENHYYNSHENKQQGKQRNE